jgi:K+-sensing histidine kinase KdpD
MSRSIPEAAGATERYERLLEVQALMARVSREIGPAVDLDHVLHAVVEAMRSLVPSDGGLISLREDDKQVIVASYPTGAVGRHILHSAHGPSGIALRTGASVRTDDVVHEHALSDEERAAAAARGIVSYLTVPLVCLGEIIGLIHVYSSEPAAFDDEAELLLEGLAIQVAGAIESARRYEMIASLEVLKSDFIARVSHELRTPITIMAGFVSTLLTNHDRLDVDTRQRMLERVDVATARLSGLIDQLLMLSRLEAGVVAANVEDVDALGVLEEVQRQAERPDAVTLECAVGLRLQTDRSLLIRALGFLVDNALKYAGSCCLIATADRIEVVDRGPGIPAARRGQVFEAFTRANEDTTVPGMGIGLPMARTLLSAAGAELRVEDAEDGVGTRMVAVFL